jgi:transmembrane sensor
MANNPQSGASMISPDLPPPAKPIREEAAAWLLRTTAPDWNADQQKQLDNWLSASEFHRAAYWRLEAAWTEATRLAAIRPSKPDSAHARKTFIRRSFRAIAAVAVFAVVGIGGYQIYSRPDVTIYATPVGGHRTLTFPDGTIIELSTNTEVSIANDLTRRQAWLTKGEAYFQIAHNADRPFVVTVGDHKVTDLGTKFLITRSDKHLEVALLEGRARVETINASGPQRATELTPGEVAVATADTMSVTTRPVAKLSNELSWRKGLLIFDGTTLADAVAEFNKYNVEQIVIRDPSILKLRVNGTFPVHARREFADVAHAVFGLRVKTQGNDTLIFK